jgi:hypothetical protein
VMRNGRVLARDTVRGGGLRNDRQLYVLADFVVPGGASDIEVRFNRIDQPSPGASVDDDTSQAPSERQQHEELERQAGNDRERIARARRAADAVPHALMFRERVTLAAREIFLVTYDRDSRSLRSTRAP